MCDGDLRGSQKRVVTISKKCGKKPILSKKKLHGWHKSPTMKSMGRVTHNRSAIATDAMHFATYVSDRMTRIHMKILFAANSIWSNICNWSNNAWCGERPFAQKHDVICEFVTKILDVLVNSWTSNVFVGLGLIIGLLCNLGERHNWHGKNVKICQNHWRVSRFERKIPIVFRGGFERTMK